MGADEKKRQPEKCSFEDVITEELFMFIEVIDRDGHERVADGDVYEA